jgi:hypothetical protein
MKNETLKIIERAKEKPFVEFKINEPPGVLAEELIDYCRQLVITTFDDRIDTIQYRPEWYIKLIGHIHKHGINDIGKLILAHL